MEQLWAVQLRYGSEMFTRVCLEVWELLWAQWNLYSACPMHFSGMYGIRLEFLFGGWHALVQDSFVDLLHE